MEHGEDETMERATDRFTAAGNDGCIYTVVEYTTFRAEVPGLKRYVTSDRQRLRHLGPGRYQLMDSGVALTRDSPDVPSSPRRGRGGEELPGP